MTLLLRGGQVLEPGRLTLERADVLVEGDRIAAVGPGLAAPEGARELDATECIILPGLINTHTHAQTHLVRGMADNRTLEEMQTYGPVLNASRTADDQYLSASIGAVEMLKTGCTAAYDLIMAIPAPTDQEVEAVARAYADVGMRAVVAPALADLVLYQTVPGLMDLLPPDLRSTVERIEAAPTAGLLRLAEEAIRRWDGAARGRIRVAVAPTIPGQCSDEFLLGCARLARQYGVGLHTHLAESKVQAIYSQQRWGKTLVAGLADRGLVGPGFVGAHAIWLTDEEIRRLADAGAAVAHNPASNLKLGGGIAPVREMLDHGLTVGLGTDGSTASDNQNMFEVMRISALVNKVRFPHESERWLGSHAVWAMATAGSARVLGMADDLGAVAPGRKADLALLRADSVSLRPLNNPLNALVYAETGASVETVLVDGRIVVERGRVVTVDEERLRARAQEAADRERSAHAEARVLAEQLTPYIRAACRAAVATPYPVNRYAAPVASGT